MHEPSADFMEEAQRIAMNILQNKLKQDQESQDADISMVKSVQKQFKTALADRATATSQARRWQQLC